ncbi:TniQ family protein [Endozoicomonas euniceicola]|uniref:TniQ family protein n=1 Tax=Endozoicomonas euniceicola TaxID=1234143 RepID=A0ABY6GRT3_9GAMM|nr:TniQ family protein [Endozoicomonas euniceicola]UYM15460.1 TniQ family protein [Endozoicomonas euniceicola]
MALMFPTPLPDESIYSLVCRYLRLTFPVKYRASKVLFGHEQAMAGPESLGRSLAYLHEQGGKQFWPRLEDMVRATTAYNLYGIFTRKRDQGYLFKTIASYYPGQRHALYQGFYHPDNKVDCLKFCPECIESDTEEFGVAYWHRSHALPFVFCCWKHDCSLIEVNSGKKNFFLPCKHSNENKNNKSVLKTNQQIAKMSYSILKSANPVWMSRELLCYVMKRELNVKYAQSESVAGDLLQAHIEECHSLDILNKLSLRLYFEQGESRPWVVESLNTATLAHIPEQLLIMVELFGSWKSVKKVCKLLNSRSD